MSQVQVRLLDTEGSSHMVVEIVHDGALSGHVRVFEIVVT